MKPKLFCRPVLTSRRIGLALAVALAADGIAVLLGPFGWTFFDEVIDVFAMIATSLLIGFHPLLLPTFLIELIPGVDMLPTWTACVAMVVALRRRQQQSEAARSETSSSSPIIDV